MTTAAEKTFSRLGQMFGARWFDTYGKTVNDEWRSAVNALRPDQVNGALASIRNSASAHPPTLPEFLALAKGIRIPQQLSNDKPVQENRYKRYGNRVLLAWLCKYGPVNERTLRHLVAEKNRLCEAYECICQDEPEASKELKGKLMESLTRVLISLTKGDSNPEPKHPTSKHSDETDILTKRDSQ